MNGLVSKIYTPIRRQVNLYRHQRRQNFIFIHINKTAGSSIETALELSLNHQTATEKIAQIGRPTWDRKFSFSVVRNPWDKVVSHYHYRLQTNQTQLGEHPIAFREWVKLAYGDRDPHYFDNPKMFMPQHDWLVDDAGNIAVDYICRFETLQEDFAHVCKAIKRKAELPHTKRSQRSHYSHYYDDESRQVVTHCFQKDIDRFGYQFGPS